MKGKMPAIWASPTVSRQRGASSWVDADKGVGDGDQSPGGVTGTLTTHPSGMSTAVLGSSFPRIWEFCPVASPKGLEVVLRSWVKSGCQLMPSRPVQW